MIGLVEEKGLNRLTNADVSVVVPFHREGVLAHATLTSVCNSIRLAEAEGIATELILVLDNADSVTSTVIMNHEKLQGEEVVLHVKNGDLATTRHDGIHAAIGTYICLVDGDDLISRSYIQNHFKAARDYGDNAIIHPEIVVNFGMYNAFNWQVDQMGQYFDKNNLLLVNPWVSAVFAHKSIFNQIPQRHIDTAKTGFGYEDWCWNCETVAAGFPHRLAWGAAYFYRRKFSGSMNSNSLSNRAIMPKNNLFTKSK